LFKKSWKGTKSIKSLLYHTSKNQKIVKVAQQKVKIHLIKALLIVLPTIIAMTLNNISAG